jgi:hypothetical protein
VARLAQAAGVLIQPKLSSIRLRMRWPPPEKLLRALLLQALYSVRSERQLRVQAFLFTAVRSGSTLARIRPGSW